MGSYKAMMSYLITRVSKVSVTESVISVCILPICNADSTAVFLAFPKLAAISESVV